MFKIEKWDLLLSLYLFCIAVTELMGAKTFPLVNIGSIHWNASVAIFVLPFIFVINDSVLEACGRERSRSLIRAGLLMVVLILLFSLLATHIAPSARFRSSEAAYDVVFGHSARIAAASLIAFALAEVSDFFIFLKIREKMGKRALWLRTNVSNFISEFLDSTIFIFLAFYALDKSLNLNLPFLWSLIFPYWIIKCGVSFLETPFVYLGAKWLKRS